MESPLHWRARDPGGRAASGRVGTDSRRVRRLLAALGSPPFSAATCAGIKLQIERQGVARGVSACEG